MKSKTLIWLTFTVWLAFLLTACGGSGAAGNDPLDGTSWELWAYRKTKPIPGSIITATFEDGKVSGSGGCNTYFGSYQVDGENITISELAITEMACMEPEGVMDQESLIMEYLGDAQRFELQENRLMIFRGDREALTFNPQ